MEDEQKIVDQSQGAIPKLSCRARKSSNGRSESARSSTARESLATEEELPLDECYDSIEYFSRETQIENPSVADTSFLQDDEKSFIFEEHAGYLNGPWLDVAYNIVIEEMDLISLLERLRVNHYTANQTTEDLIYSNCKHLFEKDYHCETIDNYGGSLSRHYPIRLIIPMAKKSEGKNIWCVVFDPVEYRNQIKLSSHSRCLTRFVAPVILLQNKYVCRSATLSVRKGAVFEAVRKPEEPKDQVFEESYLLRGKQMVSDLADNVWHRVKSVFDGIWHLVDMSSMEKIRDIDNKVLQNLQVRHICDLMIEDRKMFKQSIRVSSSEKINRDIYREFGVEQLPYPGCALFRRYHAAGRRPEGLIFNWNRIDVNIELQITQDQSIFLPDIDWKCYKEWDLVILTQNYLTLMLHYLIQEGGVLVHCISGWDRTPLFVSLLRITLWADGVIHENLNFIEMAYLTLAYDWYLFGHNLPARLAVNEEIMHFCFNFLPYIKADDFSITRLWEKLPDEFKGDKRFPEYVPNCRTRRIEAISGLVLRLYEECVIKSQD